MKQIEHALSPFKIAQHKKLTLKERVSGSFPEIAF